MEEKFFGGGRTDIRVIRIITPWMYVLTALLGCLLLREGGERELVPIYELDGYFYLISMILLSILLGWYNLGRYERDPKKAGDYIRVLLCLYLLCAVGVGRILTQIRGIHGFVVYLQLIVTCMLYLAMMHFYSCFAFNYMEASPERLRLFVRLGRMIGFLYLLAFAAYNIMTKPGNPWIREYSKYAGFNPATACLYMAWAVLTGIWIFLYVKERVIKWSLISYLLAVIPLTVLYVFTGELHSGYWISSLINFFCSVCLLIIFCNVYVERGRAILLQQKLLSEKEEELTRVQLENLYLQINPHFLYNTLGSVKSLCLSDPDQAADLVQDFSEYLQGKYRDLEGKRLVPVTEELENVRQYLRIESVRFPNLKVEYDIAADGFMLPAMSVQPLAENAVRHGIGRRRHNAGTLRISTKETTETYELCLEDNGAGFDVNTLGREDGRQHIGIKNVESRLRLLFDGELQIESTPGTGTRCTMRIYKNQAQSEKGE